MIKKYKILSLVAALGLTIGCSVGTPSPFRTGSWYYGEVTEEHIQLELVFPWAERTGDTNEDKEGEGSNEQ